MRRYNARRSSVHYSYVHVLLLKTLVGSQSNDIGYEARFQHSALREQDLGLGEIGHSAALPCTFRQRLMIGFHMQSTGTVRRVPSAPCFSSIRLVVVDDDLTLQ